MVFLLKPLSTNGSRKNWKLIPQHNRKEKVILEKVPNLFKDQEESNMKLYELIVKTPNIILPDGLTPKQLDALKKEIKGYTIGPGVELAGAYLAQADLKGVNLMWAKLLSACLSEADIREADLRGANLALADIEGADFREADLRGTDFQVWPFHNVKFQGALYFIP
jgi:hypothetical protein